MIRRKIKDAGVKECLLFGEPVENPANETDDSGADDSGEEDAEAISWDSEIVDRNGWKSGVGQGEAWQDDSHDPENDKSADASLKSHGEEVDRQ